MKTWKIAAVAALWTALPSGLRAQVPAVPGVPAGAPVGLPGSAITAPGGPIASAPPTAPTRNLWSFLFPSQGQKATFKKCLCSTQFGKFLTSATMPMSMFSGGMIGGCCPGPNAADPDALAQPPTSAEGAAARIKKSEADAAARRAAVRYLGTADCHRWPEAEAALVNALRSDPNECVRWQAAMSLGSGCCCTKKIIQALTLTVSCSNADGNPIESSWRVKHAAFAALQHCVSCYPLPVAATPPSTRPEAPSPPRRPETPESSLAPGSTPVAIDPQLAAVVANARQVLARAAQQSLTADHLPTGTHSMYHIVARATTAPSSTVSPSPPQSAPPPLATETQPSRLPPTGQRDLFHLFVHSTRPDLNVVQTKFVPSSGGNR